MTAEQCKEVNDALVEFVVRVLKGDVNYKEEIEFLPKAIATLIELARDC